MQPSSKADLPLMSTTELLVEGGDARITLNMENGTNKYGCRAYPDPSLIALGSSTASVISEQGFAAAEKLRDRLLLCTATARPIVLYAR